jgi:hypothetical protein
MKRLLSSIFLTACLWGIENLAAVPQQYQRLTQVQTSAEKVSFVTF